MTRSQRKNSNINLDESLNYLPTKYPEASQETKEKISTFNNNICSQDKKEAGPSNIYICGECNLSIKKNQTAIECKIKCNRWYHFKCSNLDNAKFEFYCKEMKKPNGKKFSCEKCKITLETKKDIENQDKTFQMEEENISKTIFELKKSIIFISDKYDKIDKENQEIFKLLKHYKKETDELKKENNNLQKEIFKFKREMNHINIKLNLEEQNKIKNNIEIKGINKQEKINDITITNKIISKIGANIETNSILKIERKLFKKEENNKNEDNSVIKITLKNQAIKEEIMNKSKLYFKKQGKITNYDINIPGPLTNIYINEELTYKNKYLLMKTKELKKYNYKFIWCKYGKIFIRKNEEDKIIQITNEEQIEKIKQGVYFI